MVSWLFPSLPKNWSTTCWSQSHTALKISTSYSLSTNGIYHLSHLKASVCAKNSDTGTYFKDTLHSTMIYFLDDAYYSEMVTCLQKTHKLRNLRQVPKVSDSNFKGLFSGSYNSGAGSEADISRCNAAVNNQVEHQVQMLHASRNYKIWCQHSVEHQPTGRSKSPTSILTCCLSNHLNPLWL